MSVQPLVIRPQDLSMKVNELSEKIIYGIMSQPEMEIVGLSSAIFLACSAVNMASDIANVHVNEISFDYVDIPVVGKFEAFLVRVGRESAIDRKDRTAEEEKGMNLSTDREGQLITVRRGEKPERLVTICLIKFQRVNKLKLIAAATAMNDAVSLALLMTEGQVAKYPIAINFVDLTSLPAREDPSKKMTGISIYLEKDHKTVHSSWHVNLLKKLLKERKF